MKVLSSFRLIFLSSYLPFALNPPLKNNFIFVVFLSSVRHVSVDLPFQTVHYNGQSLKQNVYIAMMSKHKLPSRANRALFWFSSFDLG